MEDGDIMKFIGKNGAGKTPTLKSCLGIIKPDNGEILLDGVSINEHPIACKKKMACVPDQPHPDSYITGLQYLDFICDVYETPYRERKVSLERLCRAFQMETSLDYLISSYSHGMKQKLTLIAAFTHTPKLLILDKPFVGLDPESFVILKNEMHLLCNDGNSVLFSSHILDIVEKICSKISFMKDGTLLYTDPTTEIAGTKELKKTFMEMNQNYKTITDLSENELLRLSKINRIRYAHKQKLQTILLCFTIFTITIIWFVPFIHELNHIFLLSLKKRDTKRSHNPNDKDMSDFASDDRYFSWKRDTSFRSKHNRSVCAANPCIHINRFKAACSISALNFHSHDIGVSFHPLIWSNSRTGNFILSDSSRRICPVAANHSFPVRNHHRKRYVLHIKKSARIRFTTKNHVCRSILVYIMLFIFWKFSVQVPYLPRLNFLQQPYTRQFSYLWLLRCCMS